LIERGPILLNKDGNETIYSGQWKGFNRHGRGMEVDRKEGSFYIGEWRYDEKEGYGRLVLESGNIYDGNWLNSVAHGKGKTINFHKFLTYKGKYYDSTGVLYTGDFECDL
jgi:hypothetical protein